MKTDQAFPEGLQKFIDNTKSKVNSTCHNIYLIQSVDEEGNVTEEKYGINVMTNLGMTKTMCNSSDNASELEAQRARNVYIGKGTGVVSVTDTTLFDIIHDGYSGSSADRAVTDDDSIIHYVARYDVGTGMIIGRNQIVKSYFNYNLPALTEDINITEIGYGLNATNLYSHALIYDEDGNPSYITKRINQRLYITIFVHICIHESVIQHAYENKQYLLIDPYFLYKQLFYRRSFRSCYVSAYYNKTTDVERTTSNFYFSKVVNPDDANDYIYYINITTPSFLLENPKTHLGISFTHTGEDSTNFANERGYDWYNDAQRSTCLLFTEDDKMSTDEELTHDNIYCVGWKTDRSFNNSFGNNYNGTSYNGFGAFPCVDFKISSILTYNHITKEYDIMEEFDQPVDGCYYNSPMMFSLYYWHMWNGHGAGSYVFVNTRTDLPIISFNNTSLVLYATDKYWDESTYELINDINNIDVTLQTKRYFIIINDISGKNYSLYPVRLNNEQKFINCPNIELPPVPAINHVGAVYHDNVYSNDEDEWILIGNTLIYPEAEGKPKYTLDFPNALSDTSYFCSCELIQSKGDKIIMFGTGNYHNRSPLYSTIRIYTVTNDSTVSPIYTDIILPFTTHPNLNLKNIGKISNNRWFVVRNREINEVCFIDLDDPTFPVTKITNAVYGTPMLCTDYLVYRDANSKEIVVYNMILKEISKTFTVPDDKPYTIYGHLAWNGYIYVGVRSTSDNIYSTFMFDINSDAVTSITEDMQALTHAADNLWIEEGNDECFIFGLSSYGSDNSYYNNSNKTYLFSIDNPSVPIVIAYNRTQELSMKYCNYNKQLLALMYAHVYDTDIVSGMDQYNVMIDIGKILDDGEFTAITALSDYSKRFPISHFKSNDYIHAFGFYKDYVVTSTDGGSTNTLIPIKLWLNHRVIGTTRTLQAYNNPKRITGKRFQIRISNSRTIDLTP